MGILVSINLMTNRRQSAAVIFDITTAVISGKAV